MLNVLAIKTTLYKRGEDFNQFLWAHLQDKLKENTIVAVTSKIISVAEASYVSKSKISKKELIASEADEFLCETIHGVVLTVKHGLVVPTAGIDESNSELDAEGGESYLLYPKDPYASAKRICDFLKDKSGIKNLGVIVTDSHTTPLRKGVMGIALSHWGFKAVKSFIGKEDLFGRQLVMTSVNILDALAASAVLNMGEANESQPLALLSYSDIEFEENTNSEDIRMPIDEDLYSPLLRALKNL